VAQNQQNQAQQFAFIQAMAQICPAFLQSLFAGPPQVNQLQTTSYEVMDAAYKEIDKEGPTYVPEIRREVAKNVGTDASTTFAKGCDNFITKDGQLGTWGKWALAMIKSKPESFGDKIPSDITRWCPKYPSMEKDQKDLYWVWILASMASQESTCVAGPQGNGKGPNGTAYGLFQLEYNKCPKARNLNNAQDNITCAVDLLADEMSGRATLMSPTSRGTNGPTYWGTLRSDDNNPKRGADVGAARRTRAVMSQYRYCH
jgi:hypothetical protein